MLDETLDYFEEKSSQDPGFTWEIIIVDDGSIDNTSEIAFSFVKKYTSKRIRILKLLMNRGKGGSVKRGVLVSRGKYILFADADGASDIKDFDKLFVSLQNIQKQNAGASFGSRAHLKDKSMAQVFQILPFSNILFKVNFRELFLEQFLW